jgi:hypothetical protein
MIRVYWARTFAAAAALVAVGCAGSRPYAHDPILREAQAVWGDHDRARGPTYSRRAEPTPPPAPPLPIPAEWWVMAETVTSPRAE